jgi:hypothetical protein
MSTGIPRDEKVLDFVEGGMLFQVYRTADGIVQYEGCCNGKLSITADRADLAARALVQKHITRAHERGEVVEFKRAD